MMALVDVQPKHRAKSAKVEPLETDTMELLIIDPTHRMPLPKWSACTSFNHSDSESHTNLLNEGRQTE